MDLELDKLRAFLRDLPVATGFSNSVTLMEEAFDYAHDSGAPWTALRRGDHHAFFGEETLRGLLGEPFEGELEERSAIVSSNRDYDGEGRRVLPSEPNPSKSLRNLVQRFVLLGTKRTNKDEKVACVLFHSDQVSCFDGMKGVPANVAKCLQPARSRLSNATLPTQIGARCVLRTSQPQAGDASLPRQAFAAAFDSAVLACSRRNSLLP